MSRGLYTLTSAMLTEQKKIDVTSNNLANIQTPGYKREQTVTSNFGSLLISKLKQNGIYQNAETLGPVSMIRVAEDNNTIHSQGVIDETNGDFDYALIGPGFFKINGYDGNTYYTRDGSFSLDDQGYLVLGNKGRVQGAYGDIYLGTDKYESREDGNLYISGELVDRLSIYDFDDYNNIDKISEGLFTASAQPTLLATPTVKKGSIERSNVNFTDEMVEMMSSQRSLQTGSQAIKMYDQIMDLASTKIGSIN